LLGNVARSPCLPAQRCAAHTESGELLCETFRHPGSCFREGACLPARCEATSFLTSATQVAEWYRSKRARLAANASASASPPLTRAARLRVAALIASWYGLSASLSLFNKHLLGRGRGHFPAPLFALFWQLLVQTALVEGLLRGPLKRMRPPQPSRDDWYRDVLPVGLTTAADVGASNLSLIYITVRLAAAQ
jgi:hypothetical protein